MLLLFCSSKVATCSTNYLHAGHFSMRVLSSANFLGEKCKKKSFRNTIRVSNGLRHNRLLAAKYKVSAHILLIPDAGVLAHLRYRLMVSYCDCASCVVRRQQLIQRTSPPTHLVGFWPNLAELIPICTYSLIVQMFSVSCIYRSHGLQLHI